MSIWLLVLMLWVAPALILFVALVRANVRRAAPPKLDSDHAPRRGDGKRPSSAPAE